MRKNVNDVVLDVMFEKVNTDVRVQLKLKNEMAKKEKRKKHLQVVIKPSLNLEFWKKVSYLNKHMLCTLFW